MQNLGTLPGGTFSYAYAVSADGLVVVGDSDSSSGDLAYRWTVGDGMVSLGVPPGAFDYMVCNGVNANGSAIVGSIIGAESVAFLWTAQLGIVDLNTFLPALGIDLTGWSLIDGGGVSADGRTIAGTGIHSGAQEAWIVSLGCPSDFDHDGFVTGDDFDQYVAAFEAGGIASDFNHDGFVTGDDFDAYVTAFEAGC